MFRSTALKFGPGANSEAKTAFSVYFSVKKFQLSKCTSRAIVKWVTKQRSYYIVMIRFRARVDYLCLVPQGRGLIWDRALIQHLLDKKTLILLMNCFIFSKLLYCSTVWSNTSRSNIKKLQLVQNFAARIVLGLRKFDHISQGIRSLNWLPVCDRLYLNDAIMIFKCIHNLVPDYLAEKFLFRSQTNIRNTRQSNHLNILRCRLATGQRSFSYRGAKLWNNLSNDLKNVNSVKAFKSKLTKQLLLT